MARPAFGGLSMGIHAHLDDAGRSGRFLPSAVFSLPPSCRTILTQAKATTQQDQQPKARLPLRETFYQEPVFSKCNERPV